MKAAIRKALAEARAKQAPKPQVLGVVLAADAAGLVPVLVLARLRRPVEALVNALVNGDQAKALRHFRTLARSARRPTARSARPGGRT